MRSWLFVRVPIRRGSFGRTKRVVSVTFGLVVAIALLQMAFHSPAAPEPAYGPDQAGGQIPYGAPAYCAGDGNDVGQGLIVNAEVDRDCPQEHNYRVYLYQAQQEFLSEGQPVPQGYEYPWCAPLNENPCVPTADMTQPTTP